MSQIMADFGGSTLWEYEFLRAFGVDPFADESETSASCLSVDMDLKVLDPKGEEQCTPSGTVHLSLQENLQLVAPSATYFHEENNHINHVQSENSRSSVVDEVLFSSGSGSNNGPVGRSFCPPVNDVLIQREDDLCKMGTLLKQPKEILSFFENMKPGTLFIVSKTQTGEVMLRPVFEEMFSGSLCPKDFVVEGTESSNKSLCNSPPVNQGVTLSELDKASLAVLTPERKLAFTCTSCLRQEATRSSLLTHLLSHGRPFCRLCFTTYSSKSSLQRHMRVQHTSTKLSGKADKPLCTSPAKTFVTSRYGRRRQVISASCLHSVRAKSKV